MVNLFAANDNHFYSSFYIQIITKKIRLSIKLLNKTDCTFTNPLDRRQKLMRILGEEGRPKSTTTF